MAAGGDTNKKWTVDSAILGLTDWILGRGMKPQPHCGCPQPQGALSVGVCLQGLFTGQPGSPPEMQGRRV